MITCSIRAAAFNQDISSWNTSKVTDMRYMFKEAAAFYQDITGWTTTSLTTSTGMFTGATAWLDRVQRGDGTGTSTDGPISEWVHKPCLGTSECSPGGACRAAMFCRNAAGRRPGRRRRHRSATVDKPGPQGRGARVPLGGAER